MSTAAPLINMCSPRADGSLSGGVCSDMLRLKLQIRAARTIPQIHAKKIIITILF